MQERPRYSLKRPVGEKDVAHYLQTHFPHDHHLKQVCDSLKGCHVMEIEAKLLPLLERAKQTHAEDRVAGLRNMIRAGSWRSHPPLPHPDDERALCIQHALAYAYTELEQEYHSLLRSGDVQEARDLAEARKHSLDAIGYALLHTTTGKDAEEATLAIEALVDEEYRSLRWHLAKGGSVNWAEAHKQRSLFHDRLNHLRQLRDALYFQRTHPEWFTP